MIKDYIDNGAMYYLENSDGIVAALAVTFSQGEDYHNTAWSLKLSDDEVAVVHILCVNPKLQKQGIAKSVMSKVIDLAREKGKKAVRLDALASNKPAHRLYESLGFRQMGSQNWYASNTGWTDFYLYEYLVGE